MDKVLYYQIKIKGVDDEKTSIGKLDSAIKSLTKELNDLRAATDKDSKKIGEVNVKLALAKKERSELITEIKKSTVAYAAEEGSLIQMEIALAKAQLAYRQMGKARRESAEGNALLASIKAQAVEISKLEQATGRFQRQVGSYNTAGVAMSQVLREIPAFTFSAQTGILALSNNIPILVDEMKKMSLEINKNTGAAKGWGGAIKGMAANMFSFGGIMTIALGLITIFSDKIFEAISGTKELTDAEKKLIEQQEQTNISIEKNTNAWKVYNGELTISEAALQDLAYTIGVELEKIEKVTSEKLKATEGFWASLLRNVIATYSGVTAETQKFIEQQAILAEGEKGMQEYLNKIRVDANGEAIKIANQYRQKVRELQINEIQDELERETAKLNEKRRIALEEAQIPFADGTFNEAAMAEINKAFDLEISQIKIHADKKSDKLKKEKQKLADELLELDRKTTQQQIDNIDNEFRRKLKNEENRHQNFIIDTRKRMGQSVELDKELHRALLTEEETHQANMQKIKNKAIDEQAAIKKKADDAQLQQQRDNDEAIRQMIIDAGLAEIEAEEDKAKQIKAAKNEMWSYLSQAENQYFQMQEDALDRHLRRQMRLIEQDNLRQSDVLKNRLDKGLISEAQYNADKAELDRKSEEQRLAAEKQAFEKQKRLAKAKIAVDTAIAITKGYAEGGVYYGTITGAMITALSLAQMAAVDAQEFAEGGLVLDKNRNIPTKANGDNVLTTLTAGEIVLNKKQQAMLGGNETFAKIGVPNVPNIYPNSASGGSQSGITKKDLQAMVAGLGKVINNKKVINLESENKRVRDSVANYEAESKW